MASVLHEIRFVRFWNSVRKLLKACGSFSLPLSSNVFSDTLQLLRRAARLELTTEPRRLPLLASCHEMHGANESGSLDEAWRDATRSAGVVKENDRFLPSPVTDDHSSILSVELKDRSPSTDLAAHKEIASGARRGDPDGFVVFCYFQRIVAGLAVTEC